MLLPRKSLGRIYRKRKNQWVSRDNDILIKCSSPEQGEFLVLTELQLRYKAEMPLRMRAYAALAQEKYKLPVYPVLINILPEGNVDIPNRFEANFMGLQAVQDYRVLNLWEIDAEMVFAESLTVLMPFIPIMRGGDNEARVRQAAQLIQQDPRMNELELLLGFLAAFVLGTEVVTQILRWDMVVLRESPWYQEILQQGEQRGEARGRQEGEQTGREQGRQQEAAILVLRQLTHKFGTIPAALVTRIEQLPLEQLETLSLAWLGFQGVADLEGWLQGH